MRIRFYKSETLTICTKGFLEWGLALFDESISKDPTLITDENIVLRRLLGEKLDECVLGLCFYNSKKLIDIAKSEINL